METEQIGFSLILVFFSALGSGVLFGIIGGTFFWLVLGKVTPTNPRYYTWIFCFIICFIVGATVEFRSGFNSTMTQANWRINGVPAIRRYHETGGEEADKTLREVVGYCAGLQTGGDVPEYFSETIADVFIESLHRPGGISPGPHELVQIFAERRAMQVPNYEQTAESRVDLILVKKFIRARRRMPMQFPDCIHRQLEERVRMRP